jgi:hypothetical protein
MENLSFEEVVRLFPPQVEVQINSLKRECVMLFWKEDARVGVHAVTPILNLNVSLLLPGFLGGI